MIPVKHITSQRIDYCSSKFGVVWGSLLLLEGLSISLFMWYFYIWFVLIVFFFVLLYIVFLLLLSIFFVFCSLFYLYPVPLTAAAVFSIIPNSLFCLFNRCCFCFSSFLFFFVYLVCSLQIVLCATVLFLSHPAINHFPIVAIFILLFCSTLFAIVHILYMIHQCISGLFPVLVCIKINDKYNRY